MIVVVTDFTFPDLAIETAILQPLGCRLFPAQAKTSADVAPLVADADAVLTQFARLDAAAIHAMQRARVIVRYGIGVDNVDLDAARARAIPVCNVPDYCIHEVADHTLAFILALTRCVLPHALAVRAGQWGLATPIQRFRTLRQCTVGIVGMGRIGREVARRLEPFQCRRLAHDPALADDAIRTLGCEPVVLDTLLAEADLITLHCPSTPQTRHLLNAAALARLKRGSLIVNLARGDLIDTPALIDALRSGHIAGAALDVCDPEPVPADSPLRAMDNVLLAPHIASVSESAVRTLRETAARIVACALRGEPLMNVVNPLRAKP